MGKDEDMEMFYLSCHFSVFTCVRAAVNSAVLRSSEITFGLLIIFLFCLIFFWSFPTSTCHPFSRKMKRVLSEVNWDLLFQPVESCSCDQSQFLHQNAFWTPPNLLKLSSSCLLNNFKNHHVFQSSPYLQGQHIFAEFQNFSKFFSFSNGVWCRGRIVREIGNFWRQIKKNEPLPQSTTSIESEMRCCLDRLKRYVQELLSIREQRGSSFVPQSKKE